MSRPIISSKPKIPKYITVLIDYNYDWLVNCIFVIETLEKENPGYEFVQFCRDVSDGPYAVMRYAPRNTSGLIRG